MCYDLGKRLKYVATQAEIKMKMENKGAYEKYLQEMVTKEVYYSFEENHYTVSAYPKEKEELKIHATNYAERNEKDFHGDLFIRMWEYEINSELNSYIQ